MGSNHGIPVLTYHANNVSSNCYAGNDHLALRDDLQALHGAGWQAISLDELMAWHGGAQAHPEGRRCYAVTFDDGSDFDFHDLQHPAWGMQRSLLNVLKDHRQASGESVRAASFVIASAAAREQLDRHCLIGRGWWNDEWWSSANESDLMFIESHGWDHLHPVLEQVAQTEGLAGDFRRIETLEDCDFQLKHAAEVIGQISGRRPRYFAFPWGQYSDYLVEEYLPARREAHGYHAAFTTRPAMVRRGDDRWCLPRFVCGEDWSSTAELLALLERS